MHETFGNHLRTFALAIDVVTLETFENILRMVDDYLARSFRMKFCEVLINRYSGEEVHLRTAWKTGGQGWDKPLRSGQNYQGHVSYAFAKQRPLWVIAENQQPLEKSDQYRDLLTNEIVHDLPLYVDLTPSTILTSVIIPLRKPQKQQSEIFGLINFEFATHIRATPAMQLELFSIADAIATLYRLRDLHELRTANTSAAEEILKKRRHFVRRPNVFVAFPGSHDPEVMKAIRDVLRDFEKDLDPYYWDKDPRPGDIHGHLWDKILTCQFGVCYFSELVRRGGRQTFRDSSNVLFEAGMLNALGDNPEGKPQSWIPIREFTSDRVPFDFIDQRILFVKRDAKGKLDRDAFIETFRERLEAMLKDQHEKLRLLAGGVPILSP